MGEKIYQASVTIDFVGYDPIIANRGEELFDTICDALDGKRIEKRNWSYRIVCKDESDCKDESEVK